MPGQAALEHALATAAAEPEGTQPNGDPAKAAEPVVLVADLAYASRFAVDGSAPSSTAGSARPHMRGGTPPVTLGGRHVAIMHTVYKRGGRSLYALAAYAFTATPPFTIEAISRPFTIGGGATPYPIGLLATRKHLYLSYGIADSEWAVAKLDRARLLDALVPVRTEPLLTSPSDGAEPQQGSITSGSGPKKDTVAVPSIRATARREAQGGRTTLPTRIHLLRHAPAGVAEALAAT